MGIGNTLRGDDGFGPALVKRLKGRVRSVCIDAGNTPENFTGEIVKEDPEVILLVDALHLGLSPGEYEILRKEDIAKSGLSTHDSSPDMLIEYLQNRTQADVYILGVQPESVSFGKEMSGKVKDTLDEITELIQCMNRI